jgi:signal transduction histidine kinase
MPRTGTHFLRLMDEVAQARSLDAVYRSALDCLQGALGVERAAVLVRDEAQVMRFVAWSGLSDAYRAAVEGHCPWAPDDEDPRPVLVPDVRHDPALASYAPLFTAERIAALGFIPIRFGHRLLGKFMLYYDAPHEFSDEEVRFAEMVAGHIALAVGHERGARRRFERAHRLLSEASRTLASSLGFHATLRNLSRLAVPDLADWCVIHLRDDTGTVSVVELRHGDPAKCELGWSMVRRWPTRPDAPEGPAKVIRTGAPLLFTRVDDALIQRIARDEEEQRALWALSPRSAMALPLTARDHVLGALTLLSAESGRRYGRGDLALAEEFARRGALALDNARLFEAADAARRDNARLLVEAQAAVRARDDVVAVVSHDLRTPLNTIVTACALLESDTSGDLAVQVRETIRRAAGHMGHLLDDLLDAARMEAGGVEVRHDPVDVEGLVAEVAHTFSAVAEERRIQLTHTVTPRGLRVPGDGDKLMRALNNLVGNALKFTGEGGRVSIRAEPDGAMVRVAVSDTGRGISDEQLVHLFDRFWQGHRGRGSGVGLGLAIVKGIVGAHGGRIDVVSRVGEGSTFMLVLPLTGGPRPDVSASASVSGRPS